MLSLSICRSDSDVVLICPQQVFNQCVSQSWGLNWGFTRERSDSKPALWLVEFVPCRLWAGARSARWLDAAFGSLPGGCPSAGPQPGVLLLQRQQRGHFLSKTDVTVFCNVITKMTAVTFALFCSLEASPSTEGEMAGLPKDMKSRTVDGGTLDIVWTSITVKVLQRYWSLDKQRQCRLFLNPLRQDTSSFLFCY